MHFYLPVSSVKIKFLVNGFTFVLIHIICTLFITFTKDERQYYLGVLFELLHIKKRKTKTDEAVEESSTEENEEQDGTKEEN